MNRMFSSGVSALGVLFLASCASSSIPTAVSKATPTKTIAKESKAEVRSVVFSPDSQLLAIGTFSHDARAKNVLQLRDTASGASVQTWPLSEGAAQIAFSKASKRMAVAGQSQVSVWDTTSRKLTRTISGLKGDQILCAFAYDPNILIVSNRSTLKAYDLTTGKIRREMLSDPAFVSGLAASPDGKILASTHDDIGIAIQLWDAQTLRPLRTLGKVDSGSEIVFSSDSQFVAGSDYEGTHVWRVKDGHLVGTIASGPDAPRAFAFSRDDKKLLTLQIPDAFFLVHDLATKKETTDSSVHEIAALSHDHKYVAGPDYGGIEDVTIRPYGGAF